MRSIILSTMLMIGVIGFAQIPVTHNLDMSSYTGTPALSDTNVYVFGSFNGWNSSGDRLTANGDGTYTGTVSMAGGDSEYKYIVHNATGPGTELVEILPIPSSCTTNNGPNNRLITVTGTATLPMVCWGSCVGCDVVTCDDGIENGTEQGVDCGSGEPGCPDCVDITFILNMSQESVSPQGVNIAGGGNFGSPGDFPMTDIGDGLWSITVTRAQGFSSFYAYTNGDCLDYSCKEDLSGQSCGDPGNFNDRFLPPVSNDTTLLACFGQCTEDGSCGTLADPGNIILNVDMNSYSGDQILGPNSMTVFGSFNNWSYPGLPLSDNADGTYSSTVLMSGGNHEYLYVINGAEQESFNGSEVCTGPPAENVNRVIAVDGDVTIPLVCYEACVTCDQVVDPGNVTLTVDMNNYSGTEVLTDTSMYVFGLFNGWNQNANQMTANGDGTYSTTVSMLGGQQEYKFIINNGIDAEEEEMFSGGESCTVTSGEFTNRVLTVNGDVTVPAVCFASCDACVSGPDCSAFVTAPVDLIKSFQAVNDVQDRVQIKWYKESPEIKYSDEDAAMCDIKFWKKKALDPVTGEPVGGGIQNPDTISLVNKKKTYPDASPRSIFKWPVLFRADGANNTKRADPNFRYQWKVRCECGHDGNGPESPWSAIKIFNTPNFDPATGIYTDPGAIGQETQTTAKTISGSSLSIYPNPNDGSSVNYSFPLEIEKGMRVTLRVLDMTGKVIHNESIIGQGNNRVIYFTQELNQGMYLMQAEINGQYLSERFVVK